MKKIHYTLTVLAVFFFNSCRELYEPPVKSLPDSFLVVEGVLNAGRDSTIIHLSRTFNLAQRATVKTENNAQLIVEGKDNTTALLLGTGNGKYVSANLNLVANHEYRLRIKIAAGKEYLSDYVKAKITPVIDSISWKQDQRGVQIYANTHDPANATTYYRWDYEETWEIHSAFPPQVIYENGIIRNRIFPQEDVSICWKDQSSTNILLANSLRLQSDIISEAPLVLIPDANEKLVVRYSILVRQYALEDGAYNFFELMKKNTEGIGSLFNPQPSETRGNIHCTSDPAEFVIGYITASTIETKRKFITATEIPQWGYISYCTSVNVLNNPADIKFNFGSLMYMPYLYHFPPENFYASSTPECVDCTKRGGTTVKPVFW